jgi:hypothetical protein
MYAAGFIAAESVAAALYALLLLVSVGRLLLVHGVRRFTQSPKRIFHALLAGFALLRTAYALGDVSFGGASAGITLEVVLTRLSTCAYFTLQTFVVANW